MQLGLLIENSPDKAAGETAARETRGKRIRLPHRVAPQVGLAKFVQSRVFRWSNRRPGPGWCGTAPNPQARAVDSCPTSSRTAVTLARNRAQLAAIQRSGRRSDLPANSAGCAS